MNDEPIEPIQFEKEDLLSDFFVAEDESFEKILLKLLDSEDIELKSEISKPLILAKLKTIADWLRIEKMEKPAKILDNFINTYLKYMVSKDRQSRKEIIQALTEGLKREARLTDKLMGENPE